MTKNKKTEIERRYLAKHLPEDLDKYEPVVIEDRKIITGEDHSHLRLRKKADKYILTKKYPKDEGGSGVMVEETIDLTEMEYEIFKRLPCTMQTKKRYEYKYKDKVAEIDVWMEDLAGLVMVEFEFGSEEEFREFKMPDFCLKDVTSFEWLATAKLSGKKYVDMKDTLTGMGYKPIRQSRSS